MARPSSRTRRTIRWLALFGPFALSQAFWPVPVVGQLIGLASVAWAVVASLHDRAEPHEAGAPRSRRAHARREGGAPARLTPPPAVARPLTTRPPSSQGPPTLGRGLSPPVVHRVLHILSPTPPGSWISRRPRPRISWTTALRPPPCRRIFRLARRGPQGQREPRSHQGSRVGDHINGPDDDHITDAGGDHINAGDGEGSDVHRGPRRGERRKAGAAQRRRGVPRSHQGAERSRGWFLRALPCPPPGGPPGGT